MDRSVSRYSRSEVIGDGAYGIVYKGVSPTGQTVALKRLRIEREHEGFPITALREIKILKELKHENIVRLLEIASGEGSIFLVFEYATNDISAIIDNISTPFSEAEIKNLMKQLFLGVNYLHEHWVIHRDLKCSNLLYTNRGELKIADFGLARQYGEYQSTKTSQVSKGQPMTPRVVTLWYRAPEVLLGMEYGIPIDMWSCGCIFGTLLHFTPLLAGKNEHEQLELIISLLGFPSMEEWPELIKSTNAEKSLAGMFKSKENYLYSKFSTFSAETIDLLSLLLKYNPAKRVTAKQALSHPYFTTRPFAQPKELMPTFPVQNIKQPKASETNSNSLRSELAAVSKRKRGEIAHNPKRLQREREMAMIRIEEKDDDFQFFDIN